MAYPINKWPGVIFSAGYSRLMCIVAYWHSRNKRCGEKRNAIGRRRSNFPNVEWERLRWREVGRSPVNFFARSAVWEVVREKRKAVLGVGSRTVEWGLISGKWNLRSRWLPKWIEHTRHGCKIGFDDVHCHSRNKRYGKGRERRHWTGFECWVADIRQCVTRSTAQDFVVVYHIRLLANIRGPFIRAREHTSISLDDWGFF